MEIPGRLANDPDFAIEAPDQETAERLRQLKNGYMRGEEVRAAEARLRADREALAGLEAQLRADPETFLMENIPLERGASVALQLLLEPKVWAEVAPVLQELAANDDKRELTRAQLENERLKRRDSVQQQLQEERAMTRSAEQVRQAIALCIPDQLPEADQVALYHAMIDEVSNFVERNNLRTLDPRHVPVIVADRLRGAGIDPASAAAMLASRTGRFGEGAAAPKAPTPRSVKRASAAPAGPTGQQFVAAAQAQRAVAGVAPAGAGVPSANALPSLPPGQTVEQRIEWYRQQKGIARTNPI